MSNLNSQDDIDIMHKHIGQIIRKHRKKLNLTLDDVAEKIKMTKSIVSKIERGQISVPLRTLLKITDALDISLSEMFLLIEEKEDSFIVERENQRNIFSDQRQRNYNYCYLKTLKDKNFDIFILEVIPTKKKA